MIMKMGYDFFLCVPLPGVKTMQILFFSNKKAGRNRPFDREGRPYSNCNDMWLIPKNLF
jgi:hypothetical protein